MHNGWKQVCLADFKEENAERIRRGKNHDLYADIIFFGGWEMPEFYRSGQTLVHHTTDLKPSNNGNRIGVEYAALYPESEILKVNTQWNCLDGRVDKVVGELSADP